MKLILCGFTSIFLGFQIAYRKTAKHTVFQYRHLQVTSTYLCLPPLISGRIARPIFCAPQGETLANQSLPTGLTNHRETPPVESPCQRNATEVEQNVDMIIGHSCYAD